MACLKGLRIFAFILFCRFCLLFTGKACLDIFDLGRSLSRTGYSYYDLESQQSFIYLGPGYAFKVDTKYILLSGGASMGAIFFAEEYTEDYHTYNDTDKINEIGFGINLGFGAEYKISKYLGVGVKTSLTLGSYSPNGYENSAISLSSIMFGGYISFRSR